MRSYADESVPAAGTGVDAAAQPSEEEDGEGEAENEGESGNGFLDALADIPGCKSGFGMGSVFQNRPYHDHGHLYGTFYRSGIGGANSIGALMGMGLKIAVFKLVQVGLVVSSAKRANL